MINWNSIKWSFSKKESHCKASTCVGSANRIFSFTLQLLNLSKFFASTLQNCSLLFYHQFIFKSVNPAYVNKNQNKLFLFRNFSKVVSVWASRLQPTTSPLSTIPSSRTSPPSATGQTQDQLWPKSIQFKSQYKIHKNDNIKWRNFLTSD